MRKPIIDVRAETVVGNEAAWIAPPLQQANGSFGDQHFHDLCPMADPAARRPLERTLGWEASSLFVPKSQLTGPLGALGGLVTHAPTSLVAAAPGTAGLIVVDRLMSAVRSNPHTVDLHVSL